MFWIETIKQRLSNVCLVTDHSFAWDDYIASIKVVPMWFFS